MLLCSSDANELAATCHRVLVMRKGVMVAELSGEVATRYVGRLFAQLGASVVRVVDRGGEPLASPLFAAWLDEGKRLVGEPKGDSNASYLFGGRSDCAWYFPVGREGCCSTGCWTGAFAR